jgi:hypothetical protein
MKIRFNFIFIVLVTVVGLTLTFGPLDIYASSDKNHDDKDSADSSFSLPFDSAFADKSNDGDGGDSNGGDDDDDMDVDDLPFP